MGGGVGGRAGNRESGSGVSCWRAGAGDGGMGDGGGGLGREASGNIVWLQLRGRRTCRTLTLQPDSSSSRSLASPAAPPASTAS